MKKNIWIINQYAGSPYYGMNYRSYYLAKEFVKSGHSVTIFSGSYSHLFMHLPQIKGWYSKETIEGIKYVWIKTPKYSESKSTRRVWSMLVFSMRLFFLNILKYKKPDVIIISSLSLFPVLNAYIWAKLLKVKFVFEVRDLWPLSLIELGNVSRYHPLVLLLGWIEKLGYASANRVVSVLPNAKKYMVSRGMSEEKFVYIPNGISVGEIDAMHDIPKHIQNQLPTDKFLIGYIGTVGIANAVEYLIEAAKLLREESHIHFLIVGKGGELDRLKTYCAKHHLSNVTFIAPIPKGQVQSMLKYIDLCYIGWRKKPIYQYGVSPNKIFDYMLSGKPILHAINVKNDIVQEAKCGLRIEAEDPVAIKNALLYLSSLDRGTLTKMGERGKLYVKQNHNYEYLTQRYMDIL